MRAAVTEAAVATGAVVGNTGGAEGVTGAGGGGRGTVARAGMEIVVSGLAGLNAGVGGGLLGDVDAGAGEIMRMGEVAGRAVR